MSKIAAVIANPRSAAHAGMAAEALRRTADVRGHTITIEVQSDGSGQHTLPPAALESADVVLLATDTKIDTARFVGKPVYAVRTSDAIRNTGDVLDAALALAGTGGRAASTTTRTNGATTPLNTAPVGANDAPAPTGSMVRVYNDQQDTPRSDAVRVYDAATPDQPAPATQPMPTATTGTQNNGASSYANGPVVVATSYGTAPATTAAPRPPMQDIGAAAGTPSAPPPKQELSTSSAKRLVGITSCPTGIAHTFMAAQALEKAAKALGHEIKVETQGSVGAKNQLTDEDIANADAVVIAADTNVNTSRFAGKPIYMTGTKEAMRQGQQVIQTALEQGRGDNALAAAPVMGAAAAASRGTGGASLAQNVERAKAERAAQRTGPYKHLMTGVSYMLPIIVAGGLSIALAFAFGGILDPGQEYAEGTLARAFNDIGGAAFTVFVGILSAFIAYSIADRPGIAPGLVGGLLATSEAIGAGFLGGILAGFLAGYFVKFLSDKLRLPSVLAGLMPVLILPFVGTVVVGLAMIYVIGPPVGAANAALNGWLQGLGTGNAVVLGLILGGMMAVDMGGPVNKAAYAFALGIISQVNTPIAAVMAAGMTPPLGLALAAFLFRNRFDAEEREAAKPAIVLGLAFITEGAIPFAAKDPIRVIPALILGSATAGALSMYFGIGSQAPHGGAFVFFIPNAINNLLLYIAAIAAGTLVTTLALLILKRPLTKTAAERGVDDTATVTA